MRWTVLLLAIAVVAARPPEATAAELTIDQWALGTLVHTSPLGSHIIDASYAPVTPFQTTHLSTVPPSTALATCDIAYGQTFGRFLIESSHNALGGPYGTSATTTTAGSVYFTADAPVAFVMSAAFTYDLPPVNMSTVLEFRLKNVAAPPASNVFYVGDYRFSHVGEAATGTLAVSESVILPAGHSYRLDYLTRISTSGGPFDAIATGNGYVNFSLDLLPEPATATLLLCALPLLRHRRRSP